MTIIFALDRPKTLQQAINWYGHDEDYEPSKLCEPTGASPGSTEKIQILRQRILDGETLMHADDARVVATLESQAETQLFIKFAADLARNERREDRGQSVSDEEAELKRATMREYQRKYREKTNRESQLQKRLKHITQRIKTKKGS